MDNNIAIIGAGFVGMQLAYHIAKSGLPVIAFDTNPERIQALSHNIDTNAAIFNFSNLNISFTTDPQKIAHATHYLITIPTPINKHQNPDLKPLKRAASIVGRSLKPNDLVILESTVFPGATDQILRPILEKQSSLLSGIDFFIGYSPERIVPGNSHYGLTKGVKVVAGENNAAIKKIVHLYRHKLKLKLYIAPNIQTAEACKLLENIQRDVNIALMNEFTQVMDTMGISMHEVLKAAGTKWNFLPFQPGFVGGHCIPIDPYYLIYQAQQYDIESELIKTARQVNEQFVNFIANDLIKLLNKNGIATSQAHICLLGISFKPNVPDTRHSISIRLYDILKSYNAKIYAYDPIAYQQGVPLNWIQNDTLPRCDALVLIQAHDLFKDKGLAGFAQSLTPKGIFMDIPGLFLQEKHDNPHIIYRSF